MSCVHRRPITQLYKNFAKLCHPTCGLEINQRRLKANQGLTVITQAELIKIDGKAGDYAAAIKNSPRYVNDQWCAERTLRFHSSLLPVGCISCTDIVSVHSMRR